MSALLGNSHFIRVTLFSSFWLFVGFAKLGIAAETTSAPATAIQQAQHLLKNKKTEDAAKVLGDFVRANPSSTEAAEAEFMLAQIHFRQNLTDEAIREFEAVARNSQSPEWAAKALEQLYLIQQNRRNLTAAQQKLDEMLRRFPSEVTTIRVWTAKADKSVEEKKYAEASSIYQQFETGLTPEQARRYSVAKVLAKDGNDPRALIDIGEEEFGADRRDLARDFYSRAKDAAKPGSELWAEASVKLGWAWFVEDTETGLATAEKLWAGVVSAAPLESLWSGRARWHTIQMLAGPRDQWQKAAAMCRDLARDFPRSRLQEQSLFTYAWLNWAHKNYAKAVEGWEAFLVAFPEKRKHGPILFYLDDSRTKAESSDGEKGKKVEP